MSFGSWFSQSGVQRLKRVVKDMAHSQGRHAFTIQLVNISTHVQQQLDHIIMAVYLTGTKNKTKVRETNIRLKPKNKPLISLSIYFAVIVEYLTTVQIQKNNFETWIGQQSKSK